MASLLQTTTINNMRYAVVVTRRRNARAFTLRIKHDIQELRISAPKAAKKADILRFFNEVMPKVQRHVQRQPPPPCIWLEEGAIVPIFGEAKRLTFSRETATDTFFIPYHHGNPAHAIMKALHNALLEYANRYIMQLRTIPVFAHLPQPTLTLRDTRTRWGSCAPQHVRIMLSWRLIFAPKEVMHSVILHELAHCIHADHGTAFWQLVSNHDAHYKESNAWLKAYGKTLFCYRIHS